MRRFRFREKFEKRIYASILTINKTSKILQKNCRYGAYLIEIDRVFYIEESYFEEVEREMRFLNKRISNTDRGDNRTTSNCRFPRKKEKSEYIYYIPVIKILRRRFTSSS